MQDRNLIYELVAHLQGNWIFAEYLSLKTRKLSLSFYRFRFQTKFFQGKYVDLDASLISYGPCQTPTLGFCVDRHDKIQTFKSEQFWVLQVFLPNLFGMKL